MEKKNVLSKLFYEVLNSLVKINRKKFYYSVFEDQVIDENELEKVLEEYILNVMGVSVYFKYLDYIGNKTMRFEYFREVRKYFENIIVNSKYSSLQGDLITWIRMYGKSFHSMIESYPYVEVFIEALKMNYSSKHEEIVITQNRESYSIFRMNEKNKDDMPIVIIGNIRTLDNLLEEYVNIVNTTDNFYRMILSEDQGIDPKESVKLLFFWTLRNVSIADVYCIEDFILKYIDFLRDETFSEYKRPTPITYVFDDELFIMRKKSTVAYETPYYMRFMLASKKVEFPNIRYGIEKQDGKKKAHILAIQASQEINSNKNHDEISEQIKKDLPKSKYFREFNPMQLASLVLFIGLLNGQDIKELTAYDFLAFRYQRYALESSKSEEELHAYQHRLTNKFINTFMRMLEYTNDIEILNYPDHGNELKLRFNDEIRFSSPLLQELYDIGYQTSLKKEKKLTY